MMDWLIKVRDGTPCPCCRQEFTDLPIIPRLPKLNITQQQQQQQLLLQAQQRRLERTRSFDITALSFR